jgi:hypothetical protein
MDIDTISYLLLVGWHAAEYIIGSAFAARKELAEVIFLPTGLTGGQYFQLIHKKISRSYTALSHSSLLLGASHAQRGKEKVAR